MKVLEYIKKNKFSLAIVAIFSVLLLGWIYINLRVNYAYDQDAAKLMYHTIKIWEGKRLALPNWNYSTTGEWDCSAFFALPIYGICGNIFRAFGIANIINILLLCTVVYLLFEALDIKKTYAFLAMVILLLPYDVGMLEYSNMLLWSGEQYIYKVLIPICVITLFHIKGNKKITYVLLALLTAFLLFLTTTSSGIYVTICGIVPIFAMRAIEYIRKKGIDNKRDLITIAMVSITFLVGMYLHKRWGVASNADTMMMVDRREIWKNIEDIVVDALSVFNVFGKEYVYVKAISSEGFLRLMKLLLVSLMYYFAFVNIPMIVKKYIGVFVEKDTEEVADISTIDIAVAELLAVAVCNVLILLFTHSAVRYHYIGSICIILVSVITFSKCKLKTWVMYVGIAFLALISLLMFYKFSSTCQSKFSRQTVDAIIETAYEVDASNIISIDSSEWSEILRVYDPSISCVTYKENQMMDCDVYRDDRGISVFSENNILFVSREDELVLPEGVEGYVYLKSIDKFDIYTNIE